ncbi:MAG: mersacidin/lichenicidin family type 2 lantibiotic [Pyrinomonadaceae bacterium]
MSKADVIRAWKDPEYRSTLGPTELAGMPENPAGAIELNDDDLDGSEVGIATTYWTCTCTTATRQITCTF